MNLMEWGTRTRTTDHQESVYDIRVHCHLIGNGWETIERKHKSCWTMYRVKLKVKGISNPVTISSLFPLYYLVWNLLLILGQLDDTMCEDHSNLHPQQNIHHNICKTSHWVMVSMIINLHLYLFLKTPLDATIPWRFSYQNPP